MAPLGRTMKPISPCLFEQLGQRWICALLWRPDFDVAHAFARAYQQLLRIRHESAVEEAEIDVRAERRDVESLVKASISRAIPQRVVIDDFVRIRRNRANQRTKRHDQWLLLGW